MRNIYYSLKPFVPRALRIAVRSSVAEKTRKSGQDIWPIDPISATPPDGWKGWPDGKKFAVVLTHDVEDTLGVAKCPELQQIETTLGFKSSFNFIPEGTYKVPPALRKSLVDAGFEVGIHDLHHNGKLFHSRKKFEKSAARINQYLADWNAVGFRAGFMLRNLDWYHDLNILYDASTFDTDPFEPQPEAARTIFPYWIDRPQPTHDVAHQRRGYVELPYTLPQDSNLFLILKESTPRIWIEKMHWIAQHGGMVLINVHPDYIRHSDSDKGKLLYPASHYADLLKTIREQYAGQYWNPLPKELALWYKDHKFGQNPANPVDSIQVTHRSTQGALRTKRAAVILYSTFPSDPRPRRAAEAMVQEGMEVDFFCLGEKASPPEGELQYGVRVFRYPMQHQRDNKFTYLIKYGRFLLAAFMFLTKRSLRRRYDIVHVHNMPDFLIFSAITPKLLGAKAVLDLHDPMPELMTAIFGRDSSLSIRILRRLEKLSIGFADHAITANIAFKRIFASRSCADSKVTVIMNSPSETIFTFREVDSLPAKTTNPSEKPYVIMYHGSLVERHGLDLAIDALAILKKEVPLAELRIYGSSTPYLTRVLDSITDPTLKNSVHYFGPKPLEVIVEAIRECDVGIIPNRRSVFTEYNMPTRIFEYLSQGKPVIAPRSVGILDYFSPKDLIYFELGDLNDLAKQMQFVHDHPEEVREIIRRGQTILHTHTWTSERNLFINTIVDVLKGEPESRKTASVI